jgi:hypothetical protein
MATTDEHQVLLARIRQINSEIVSSKVIFAGETTGESTGAGETIDEGESNTMAEQRVNFDTNRSIAAAMTSFVLAFLTGIIFTTITFMLCWAFAQGLILLPRGHLPRPSHMLHLQQGTRPAEPN